MIEGIDKKEGELKIEEIKGGRKGGRRGFEEERKRGEGSDRSKEEMIRKRRRANRTDQMANLKGRMRERELKMRGTSKRVK